MYILVNNYSTVNAVLGSEIVVAHVRSPDVGRVSQHATGVFNVYVDTEVVTERVQLELRKSL